MITISLDHFLAFCLFALVSTITPGPNNLMVMASGLSYGFRRTLPHLLGVAVGFAVMVFATGFGIRALFAQYPGLQLVLKLSATLYFLWMAYQLCMTQPGGAAGSAAGKPMSFLGAAAFQWINPKAWVMALSALGAYLSNASTPLDVALLAAVYGVLCLPCVGAWAAFGTQLNHVLKTPGKVMWFNRVVAVLLLLSLYPIVFG